MEHPQEICCIRTVSREEAKFSLVDALKYSWLDIGHQVGQLMSRQKKFSRQVNNPDGSFDCIFEAFIFSKEEYEKSHGIIIYKEPQKEERLSGLIGVYIVVIVLATIVNLLLG